MATKPNRTTETAILVRCSRAEKALIERACAQVVVGGFPGTKLHVRTFVLQSALAAAEAILPPPPEVRTGEAVSKRRHRGA